MVLRRMFVTARSLASLLEDVTDVTMGDTINDRLDGKDFVWSVTW